MAGYYTPAKYRSSTHVKRKLHKEQNRTCQRCAKTFKTLRDVPYCWPCYREKRQERQAAYIGRALNRLAGNRAGVDRAED